MNSPYLWGTTDGWPPPVVGGPPSRYSQMSRMKRSLEGADSEVRSLGGIYLGWRRQNSPYALVRRVCPIARRYLPWMAAFAGLPSITPFRFLSGQIRRRNREGRHGDDGGYRIIRRVFPVTPAESNPPTDESQVCASTEPYDYLPYWAIDVIVWRTAQRSDLGPGG